MDEVLRANTSSAQEAKENTEKKMGIYQITSAQQLHSLEEEITYRTCEYIFKQGTNTRDMNVQCIQNNNSI